MVNARSRLLVNVKFTDSLTPHRQPGRTQGGVGFGDAMLTEMEDRGRQYGGRAAVTHPFNQMTERADSTARDHRHRHRIGHRPSEREIIAPPRAVAIH